MQQLHFYLGGCSDRVRFVVTTHLVAAVVSVVANVPATFADDTAEIVGRRWVIVLAEYAQKHMLRVYETTTEKWNLICEREMQDDVRHGLSTIEEAIANKCVIPPLNPDGQLPSSTEADSTIQVVLLRQANNRSLELSFNRADTQRMKLQTELGQLITMVNALLPRKRSRAPSVQRVNGSSG